MKVKVNINTRCILMSQAVTEPSLTVVTSTVFEESLARDTHAHTHIVSVLYVKVCFANKKSKTKVQQ